MIFPNTQYSLGLSPIIHQVSLSLLLSPPPFPPQPLTSPFPPILDTIDLQDPKNYRDLSKPVGVLAGEERREFLKKRYESLEEGGRAGGGVPPFHFGSHYSSLGVILFFMIRVCFLFVCFVCFFSIFHKLQKINRWSPSLLFS